MDDKSYADAKYALYSLAHSLGSNKMEQEALVDALREIEKGEREGKITILLSMFGVFYDGLAYGNWPWMIKQLKRGDV